jgi:hypothetical protein
MWTAFPSSEYYGGAATPPAHQPASSLTGRHQQPVASGAFPTFTMIRLTGWAVGYTPAAPPRGNRSIPSATGPGSMSRDRRGPPSMAAATLLRAAPIRQVLGC